MFIYVWTGFYFLINFLLCDVASMICEESEMENLLRQSHTFEESGALVRNMFRVKAPISPRFKSTVWDYILQEKHIRNLTVADWNNLKVLIPYIPTHYLQGLDFLDDRIIQYFGKLKLEENQFALMAEMIIAKRGNVYCKNERNIINMGNIFCGLSNVVLKEIRKEIFRSLVRHNHFKSLDGCSATKLNLLSSHVQNFRILGPPRTWKPKTVESLESILPGLNVRQIREIRSKSFANISPDCIRKIPNEVLLKMRTRQLAALPRPSLLAWRRKTMDTRPIYLDWNSGGSISKKNFAFRIFERFLQW